MWTVESLRSRIDEYVNANEHADRKNDKDDTKFKKTGQPRLEGRTKFSRNMNTRPKQTYFDRRYPASYNTIIIRKAGVEQITCRFSRSPSS